MASGTDRLPWRSWLSATALSATGWWLGSGTEPRWWATWLAAIPVLWLASRVRTWWAVSAALLAFSAGSSNLWPYLHGRIGLPLGIVVYAMALPGVLFALCVLLHKRLLRRERPLAATLAVPVVWVGLAYVNSVLSPHGTFFDIGYTQMDALPVIQIVAVTGIWGVGSIIMLAASVVAVMGAPHVSRPARATIAGTATLLLAGMLIYGYQRLETPSQPTLRVGLVALNADQAVLDTPTGRTLQDRYGTAIARLAGQGARAIVIPEASFITADATIPAFAQLARQHDAILNIAVDFNGDPHAERNMAMVFQPGAPVPLTYNKRHLIPGFEDKYTPGSSEQMLPGTPRIGLAICKDMDFQDIGIAYGVRGAQLLLVPAWDFVVDGWLHSRMAIMRGVEGGFAVARVARFGRLTLSDDRGRVVAEASSEDRDAELVGDVPLHQTRTLYARWGNWFAWLDLTVLLILVVLAVVPGNRGKPVG